MGSTKKHKKHKKEKYEERLHGLKLILKVGTPSTPEHSDSPGPIIHSSSYTIADEESTHSILSYHKKSKKKKKKKDKDRDRHERKRKHHHKEKKRKVHDESSQDYVSLDEEPSVMASEPLVKSKDEKDHPSNETIAQHKEPRVCVLLRQKQEKLPFQRVLEHLQKQMEKKDPQQFFQWPVTDQIAPGYSQTITHPMDFSTMRQKIEDNAYTTLNDYIADLRLMCNNAMVYNLPDTIYYKSAKRLLHFGLKLLSPEKLRQTATTVPGINQVPLEQLGFQINPNCVSSESAVDIPADEDEVESKKEVSGLYKRKLPTFLQEEKFTAIPDDLTAEEVLEQAEKTAKAAADRLAEKRPRTSIGFLRQPTEGSTSLAIFVPGDGLNLGKQKERSVSLGQLVGKLTHGTGQLQGIKEDRRNIAKTVKPLNYGAFGSYAPSYDSTFANLSKEESDLLYETYGDENATVYAESVLNFAKDCDYTLTMVDNLLDLLTGGEHRKTKSVIDEQRKFREEEERVRELMESKGSSELKTDFSQVKIEIDQLKTLTDLGIDTSFLNELDNRDQSLVQQKLDQTTVLIEKLSHAQTDRLSAPPPSHLSQIVPPSDSELNLADKITESLTELAKQVPPGAIISVPAIRKVMGIGSESNIQVTNGDSSNPPLEHTSVVALDGEDSGVEESCVGVGQLDLESELREFLESDSALTSFPLHDDKTIEEMLSES